MTAAARATDAPVLVLRPEDDVAVATRDLSTGDVVDRPGGGTVAALDAVPRGHKVALRDGVEHGDRPAPGAVDDVPGREVARRDGDVVLGAQDEQRRVRRARSRGHDGTASGRAAATRSSDTPRSAVATTCPVSSERFTATPTATLRRPST